MLSRTCLFALLLSNFIYSVSSCPDGFVPWHEGYCYRLSSKGNWSFSNNDCHKSGGEFTSIHSELQNKRVTDIMRALGKYPLWNGMECDSDQVAYWADGSDVEFIGYDVSFCPLSGKYGMFPNEQWQLTTADNNWSGACRHKKRNEALCGDYDQIDGLNVCVSVHTDAKTWSQAEAVCQRESAHLISIHDKKSNDLIAKMIGTIAAVGTSGGAHIGLQSQASAGGEVYNWTDGSSTNFHHYARGFPQDLFGHCTAMETTPRPGPWITVQCEDSALPYICARPVNKPTAAAGCPSNFRYQNAGTIFSPSYPVSEGPINCEYFFEVKAGKRVQLVVEDLNTNLCCDKLSLYNGFISTTPFATLSGSSNKTIFTSSGTDLRMSYDATDGTSTRGWKVTFSAV